VSRRDPIGVFVYGTLKRGEGNHHLLAGAVSIEDATTSGRLFDLGYFPAMTLDRGGLVHGELAIFSDLETALPRLDRLEGFVAAAPETSHYLRVAVPVHTVGKRVRRAWTYVYSPARLDRAPFAEPLPGGLWAGRLRAR
jgi:gamma-glutamylcyclotransferase (GGCT)/AIG2-like uncharacterized protein YtfP